MIKRILLALTLATSLGSAVLACNSPAATGTPAAGNPSTAPASVPAASNVLPSPSAS